MAIFSKETALCKFLTRLLISILLLVSGSVNAYPGPASTIPGVVQTTHNMVGSMKTKNLEKEIAYQQSSSYMYLTECMEKETSRTYICQVFSSQSSIALGFKLITSEEVTSQVLMYQEEVRQSLSLDKLAEVENADTSKEVISEDTVKDIEDLEGNFISENTDYTVFHPAKTTNLVDDQLTHMKTGQAGTISPKTNNFAKPARKVPKKPVKTLPRAARSSMKVSTSGINRYGEEVKAPLLSLQR